ncbi:MAG: hypothetical protein WC030_01195 [Candidatus Paceibacterota bacterium]
MPFSLDTLGTLLSWTNDRGEELLFPQGQITIGGQQKLRGGAHVCAPIFGTQPKTSPYEGVNLPQHGLVRVSGSSATQRAFSSLGGFECRVFSFDANEVFPWSHEVLVKVSEDDFGNTLHHELAVGDTGLDRHGRPMPLSMGVHPYFATRGQPFEVGVTHEDGIRNLHCAELAAGKSVYIPRNGFWMQVDLRCSGGVVMVSIAAERNFEGGYTGINLWSDSFDRYLCIEPVLGRDRDGKPDPVYLEPGEGCTCRCSFKFSAT